MNFSLFRALVSLSAALLFLSPLSRALADEDEAGEIVPQTLFRDEAGLKPPESDRPPSPEEEKFQALQNEALSHARSIEAAIPLIRAAGLADDLPSWEPMTRLAQRFCRSSKTDPRVRELACRLYADAERHRGRLAKSDQALISMGLIGDFLVAGPFDNEGQSGCRTAQPPEISVDLTGDMQGKVRPVRWRPLPDSQPPPNGLISFSSLFTPTSEITGFALTSLSADKDTEAILSLDGRGAFEVFIDGKSVFKDDRLRPFGNELARIGLTLPQGKHTLMVKVCGDEDAPALRLLLHDAKGRAIPGLTSSLPTAETLAEASASARADKAEAQDAPKQRGSKGKKAKKQPPPPQVTASKLKTLADEFEEAAKKSPKDWRAQWKFAVVARAFGAGAKSDRTAIQASEKAAELSGGDIDALLLAASFTDKLSDEMNYLSQVLAKEPGNPWAALRLALLADLNGQPQRALKLLDASLAANPNHLGTSLARARLMESAFGLSSERDEAINALLERWPDRVMVLTAAAQMAESMRDLKRAAALLRTALSLDFSDLSSRRSLAGILLKQGDSEGAADEYGRVLTLTPWNASDWLKRAQILGMNGHEDEALSSIERAVAIDPDNAALHERAGRIFSSMGLSGAALKSFQKSLELKPQNAELREKVQALTQSEKRFGEDMVLSVQELAKAHPPREGEDAVILQELTAIQVYPNGLSSRLVRQAARAQTQRGVEQLRRQWMVQSDRQNLKILSARIHRPDGSISESKKTSFRSLSDPSSRLYYDVRAEVLDFPSLAPGDILEVTWHLSDTSSDNLLSDYFGDIHMLRGEAIKERFDYAVLMPPGRKLFFSVPEKVPGLELSVSESPVEGGGTLYRFSASGVPKFVPEPNMPGAEEISGLIHVSTYEKWEDVGRYWASLVKDQLTVTDSIEKALAEILAPLPDKKDRLAVVRAVYAFVVSRTRYVGLEFGIHGFKPYPAHKVLSRRFGDCKDKASLMHVLLKAAGIESNLVLLRMMRHGAISPFPASLAVFDHAILYVPEFDLFLDGTAELHGPDELPPQDTGAQVLIISANGESRFASIPDFPPDRTVSSTTLNVALSEDGSARVRGSFSQSGQRAPSLRRAFQSDSQQSRRQTSEMLFSRLFSGLSMQKLDVSDVNDIFSPVTLSFEFQTPRFADAEKGKSLRFRPFGTRSEGYAHEFAPLAQRQTPLFFAVPDTRKRDVTISLPSGFRVSSLPAPVQIETPHVHFTLEAAEEDGGRTIRLTSSFAVKVRRISPEDYAAFRDALREVDTALDGTLTAAREH